MCLLDYSTACQSRIRSAGSLTSCWPGRMPWEDPSTAFGVPRGPQLNLPPPEIAAKQLKAAAKQAAELRVCAHS